MNDHINYEQETYEISAQTWRLVIKVHKGELLFKRLIIELRDNKLNKTYHIMRVRTC
jgi:hypothetical protein